MKAEVVATLPIVEQPNPEITFEDVAAEGVSDVSTEAAAQGVSDVSAEAAIADHVCQRLQMISKQQTGIITHRYTVEGLLAYLELSSYTKPSVSMNNVLAASATILLALPNSSLIAEIRNNKFDLPSIDVLRRSRLRLDLLRMRFDQHMFLRFDCLTYLLIDSSPQLGYDFLICIEDVVKLPEAETLDLARRAAVILNEAWESILLPFSSVGYGRAGAVKKTQMVVNLQLMAVSCMPDFDKKRCQYRGSCIDQGTETAIRITSS